MRQMQTNHLMLAVILVVAGRYHSPWQPAWCLYLEFLVQLDQSNQQLEVPPIPDLTMPDESKDLKLDQPTAVLDNIETEEDSSSLDSALMDESPTDNLGTESQANIIQSKEKLLKKVQPEPEYLRERQQLEEQVLEPSKAEKSTPIENTQSMELNRKLSSKPKANESSENFADKPKSIQKQASEPGQTEPALDGAMQSQSASTSAVDSEARGEQEYASIPVGDWLLMIEKLIARKDYAEAARQLQKFKQAHPKVNVEDLDAKIP